MYGIYVLDEGRLPGMRLMPCLINSRDTRRQAVAAVKTLKKVHANRFGVGKLPNGKVEEIK